ncbi:hypothetical protein [Sulfurimonas hydrogeniphila]|uniref:hypothetical protein n=1 Tax=Sulfurimonas hydrogeniphila TaxID=2509341 RepID=UPI00125FD31B|nr:hypothetical protein [Sulfurimonas hydrogeniphila]
MKTKHNFRNAFGMGQIMAMLLVVLPTLAFIITLMTDYWSVMQEDYKLKLIANQTSTVLDSEQDLRSNTLNATLDTEVGSRLCPKGTTISFSTPADATLPGQVIVTIKYTHNGHYFKNKTLSTQMQTYSYHDQNISITGTCQ